MRIKFQLTVTGLGEEIRQAREERRLSQTELAKLMNLSVARISEIENEVPNRSNITIEQVLLLEKYLERKILDRLALAKMFLETLIENQK